mmetsp:Transcript_12292/g.28760  ORF Transcript_12292/g.28760 Transcript_12292/m.28760 type:complete len:201 (+) Transcript_12292:744-1346(+)
MYRAGSVLRCVNCAPACWCMSSLVLPAANKRLGRLDDADRLSKLAAMVCFLASSLPRLSQRTASRVASLGLALSAAAFASSVRDTGVWLRACVVTSFSAASSARICASWASHLSWSWRDRCLSTSTSTFAACLKFSNSEWKNSTWSRNLPFSARTSAISACRCSTVAVHFTLCSRAASNWPRSSLEAICSTSRSFAKLAL